ncbi:hypothetical protein MKQ70_02810 [Chitinophaga sedimenti]|uniref:hypothetical protein n=1 Tax=Chitinophaga sedimenti TaxID=2033606 RepID=UPI0020062582|nr:hypothetical protein [Chitinophaga sedimenti]MCK7553995.1 hypothetical protein [Chitinophaga sedimenti]
MGMKKEDIFDWLTTAFSEPLHSLTESFYYDKRDREFYSLHFADYLLINEDLTINESVESSYNDSLARVIVDRIVRQEKGDSDIIPVPRLEVAERKRIMEAFSQRINDERLLSIVQQRIKNQDGSQRFDFYFGDEAWEDLKQQWIDLKYVSIAGPIGDFLNAHGIDLDQCTIMDAGGDFSITVSLED